MKDQSKRLTFVVPPEIEAKMNELKRDVYYDCTKSEMIRELVAAGVRSCKVRYQHVGEEMKNA